MVNWARVADGPALGGGANSYARDLAMELAALGHEVTWISGGLAYVPASPRADRPPAIGPCVARRMPDVPTLAAPIRVIEIVNSPVLAHARFQFRDPIGEIAQPDLEREFLRVLHLVEPDAVHFHNIEGFSIGCVDASHAPSRSWPGAAVLFSLHNYHTICPQVYLMQRGRHPCHDSRAGRACAECADAPPREVELTLRLTESRDAAPPREPDRTVASILRRWIDADAPALPGRALRGPDDWRTPFPPSPDIPAPPVPSSLRPVFRPGDFTPADPGEPDEPLDNHARPDPPSPGPGNDYALRRRAMIDMLGRCDRVLAVSEFVRLKFLAMGVPGERLATMPIGSRLSDQARAAPASRPDRAARPPLVLGFLGYHNHYKGLHVLARALERLPDHALARLALHVHAKDVEMIERRLLALADPARAGGRLAGLVLGRGYDRADLSRLCDPIDLGVVPSVWWDNSPQTAMEFLAHRVPVLGSRVGGIPDLVREGDNGLLVRAGDSEDLARALARVAAEPSIVATLARRAGPGLGMAAHARDVEAAYRECVEGRRAGYAGGP